MTRPGNRYTPKAGSEPRTWKQIHTKGGIRTQDLETDTHQRRDPNPGPGNRYTPKAGSEPRSVAVLTTRPTKRQDRLGGLAVMASASRADDPGFESCWRRDFSGSNHASNLNIGILVSTLSGAWHYRVSAGTGRCGVSIL